MAKSNPLKATALALLMSAVPSQLHSGENEGIILDADVLGLTVAPSKLEMAYIQQTSLNAPAVFATNLAKAEDVVVADTHDQAYRTIVENGYQSGILVDALQNFILKGKVKTFLNSLQQFKNEVMADLLQPKYVTENQRDLTLEDVVLEPLGLDIDFRDEYLIEDTQKYSQFMHVILTRNPEMLTPEIKQSFDAVSVYMDEIGQPILDKNGDNLTLALVHK